MSARCFIGKNSRVKRAIDVRTVCSLFPTTNLLCNLHMFYEIGYLELCL